MNRKHLKLIALCLLGVFIVIFAILQSKERTDIREPQEMQGDAAVREAALAFGTHLKDVPLLAEDLVLKQSIEKAYKPYVTNELLSQWLTNPKTAPGRLTSSPWPDHFDIVSVNPFGKEYVVKGNVVLMTSAEIANSGNAGTTPFEMTLVDSGDGWRVASYAETQSPKTDTPTTTGQKEVKAKLNSSASAFGMTLVPLEVVEDSRCPINARCIQAGTLKVKTRLTSTASTPSGTVVFTIGEPLVWNGYTITLTDTDPQKMTTTATAGFAYIYEIKK